MSAVPPVFSAYEHLRRTNPTQFYTPTTLRQMYWSAKHQGPAFFDHPSLTEGATHGCD